MHRSTVRRRSAARILGWAAVIVAYAVVVVWAGDIISGSPGPVATAATEAGAMAAAGPIELDATMSAVDESIAAATEAPLVKLGIAAVMVLGGAGWYLLTMARRPRQRCRARLLARQITTLT